MKTYSFGLKFYQVGLTVFLLALDFHPGDCQIPELQNSDNFKIIALKYSNSSGERGITEFEYNALGQLAFSRWKNLSGERSSINRYESNSKGEIIEKTRLFSDSISSRQSFDYNLCGKILKENFSRSDGVTGQVIYSYNEHGKLESASCQQMNGWFTGNIEYIYNSYDVLDEATVLRENKKIGKIIYQYDINGNLILEKWDFNGTWEQILVYEYIEVPNTIYASSNPFIVNSAYYRIKDEYYSYEGGSEGPSSYLYLENKLVKKIFQRSDGLTTETHHQYDELGLLLNSTRNYSDGKTAEFFYTFNDKDQMTRRWFKRSDGLEGEEVYTYDAEGRLVMAEYEKMDAWLTGTMAFSHNSEGLPIKGFFKGEENFDADVYFFYDDYKNLMKIRWDFSIGKSQTYTFQYEAIYVESSDKDEPPQ
jgi:hypothetical protein